MANPVMKNTKAFQEGYAPAPPDPSTRVDGAPAPIGAPIDTGAMSYEGVLSKALGLFTLAVGSALVVGLTAPQLALPLSFGAFIMSLVVAFRKKAPSPALYSIVIALWGGAAGGLSAFYEHLYNGIIMHALIATATVFVVSLAVYKSGRIRNIAKVRKFLMIAVPAIVVFSLIDVGVTMMGGSSVRDIAIPGVNFPLIGLVISLVIIVVGAFMLISDFDFVDNGVQQRVPAIYEWTAAYGLVFAIIWIYIEMLRLLAILRGR